MTGHAPKWSRRKDARPTEIVEAAIDLFVAKGFAGTTLSEVARRAGVVKGTLYLYFETKEDLFRAAARQAFAENLEVLERSSATHDGSVAEMVPMMLKRVAARIGDGRIPGIMRMVLAESRAFPDLARIWHDEIVSRVLSLLTELIVQGQQHGEVRQGDPKLFAISIAGPMVMALLFREVFGDGSAYSPDLQHLADQHAAVMIRGMMAE